MRRASPTLIIFSFYFVTVLHRAVITWPKAGHGDLDAFVFFEECFLKSLWRKCRTKATESLHYSLARVYVQILFTAAYLC